MCILCRPIREILMAQYWATLATKLAFVYPAIGRGGTTECRFLLLPRHRISWLQAHSEPWGGDGRTQAFILSTCLGSPSSGYTFTMFFPVSALPFVSLGDADGFRGESESDLSRMNKHNTSHWHTTGARA